MNQPNSHSGWLMGFLPPHFAQDKAEGGQAAPHESCFYVFS